MPSEASLSTVSNSNPGTLPDLIPKVGPKLKSRWEPKTHLEPARPAQVDIDRLNEKEMIANLAASPEAPEYIKNPKKIRPRRTVDLYGGYARWNMVRKQRPNPTYTPAIRPAPPFIIDLLPPKAYSNNSSTSICTKFVHTSTNKIRFPVNVVTWTPEARRVLTGSTSGEFTLWNGLTFNFETILQAHDSPIRTFQFNHAGSYLVSADQSGIIKYFQPNMNNVAVWNGHREAISGLSWSPDDTRFATCSDDKSIKLWQFEVMSEERALTGHGWDVRCVQWHPTKGLLASGSKDNLVKFWDPRTAQCLSTLHYHKNTVQSLEWSPNGDMIATASRDQTVRVFDVRAMKEFGVYKGHKKEVCSIAWHPVHHELLCSGGADGQLIYWLLHSPEHVAMIEQAHESNIWSLAWHPLGHILCTGSSDYMVRFWCRDRPGERSGAGAGGVGNGVGGEKGGGDDEEDEYVPGFAASYGGAQHGSDHMDYEMGGGMWGGAGGFGAPVGGMNGAQDDFIPGFGGGAASAAAAMAGMNGAMSAGGGSHNNRPPFLPPIPGGHNQDGPSYRDSRDRDRDRDDRGGGSRFDRDRDRGAYNDWDRDNREVAVGGTEIETGIETGIGIERGIEIEM
ncbi:WD40-repeat-containing domain protein [Cantharellus anzutake]|uniref:WD40-repeat-containing domain protein n=1 Tax=Cantharellus anzutake TaxID=1750568 RepID=UPI0019052FCE|nr:WD40-repeat-containing domain protein [Cantharellus anzutake]KAF8344126.1 WD40-repeat-containing domain protein [Cantharellus anzutake]